MKRMTMTVTSVRHAGGCGLGPVRLQPGCVAQGCTERPWTSMPKAESAEWHLRIARNTNACGQPGRGTKNEMKVSCPDCECFMYADEDEERRVAAGY